MLTTLNEAEIEIRPMERCDIADLVSIEGPHGWKRDEFITAQLQLRAQTFVRVVDDLVVSFITWHIKDGCLHVINLATHVSHRRQGHATALIEFALDQVPRRGSFKLVCKAENYETRGLMKACGIHEIHAPLRGYYEDSHGVLFCRTMQMQLR